MRPPRPPDPDGDLTARAEAAHRAGQLDQARALYRRVLAEAPEDARILFLLGVLELQAGRGDAAVAQLTRAVARQPGFLEAHVYLGNALQSLGRSREAARHYAAALRIDPGQAGVHVNLGNLLQASGRTEAARRHLEQALALDPGLPEAHNSLGLLLQREGHLESAIEHYRQAIARRPDDPAAHNNLGNACRALGRLDEALTHYRTALAIRPNAQSHVNLATTLERANRPEAAREAAKEALAAAPGEPGARLVLAKTAARLGDPAGARRDYEALISDLGEPRGEARALTVARAHADLARLYEKDDRFDEAMEHFTAAKQLNRRSHPDWQREAADYLAWVRGLSEMLRAAAPAWRPGPLDDGRPAPIFLVGFPRSGTTLLDQALDVLPEVVLLQEKTVVDELRERLGEPEESRLRQLMEMSDTDRAALRAAYWERASGLVDVPLEGRRLVDKLPLNILNLWLIHGIFPESRIVVSLRDPRDVCLSCFTTLFRQGDGVANFPTLEDSAALYREVMGLWQIQRDRLPLSATTLRYEDLVGSFETELRRVTDFLDLPWRDEILDFPAAARNRYIVTPSYDQVVQPLYSTSIGRWRHYARHLDPILPDLEPFIEEFGYK